MSVADARADLVATLSDSGYKVLGYEETKNVSGLVVVTADRPFLEYGDVLSQPGLMKVNFNVFMFQEMRANPEYATRAMDKQLQAVVLNLGEWTLTDLESHIRMRLEEGGPVWLASRMSVTNYFNVKEVL